MAMAAHDLLPAPLSHGRSEDEFEARYADALRAHGTPMADPILGPMLRASPLLFAQTVIKGPPQRPYLGRLLFGEHHLAWEDIVTDQRRYCILAARGMGKSWFFTFIVPLWRMACDGDGSMFIFSATEVNAQRMVDMIRSEIEENPKLQWLYPQGNRKHWTSSHMVCSNGYDLKGRGYHTRVRGAHPTDIVGDDVLSEEDFFSPTQRKKSKEYWFSAITNMVGEHGRIGCVGTPFAADDLFASLKDTGSYHCSTFSALTSDERSAWPEVWSTIYLKELEKEIGTVRFGRELRCRPISDDMSLLPRSLFYQDGVMQPLVRLGMPRDWWVERGVDRFYVGVDFAFSSSVAADYFVVWIIGLDDHDNRWIVDIHRDRGVSFNEQKALIVTYGVRYQPEIMHLEANQAQRIVADDLIQKTDLPIRKYVTGAEKHSLEHGIPSLSMLLENRKYRVPRGCPRSVELTDEWMSECSSFTFSGGKVQSVGGHDDLAMSMFLTEQAIRKGGFSFKFGGSDDERREAAAMPNVAAGGLQAHLASADPSPQAGTVVMRRGVAVRI